MGFKLKNKGFQIFGSLFFVIFAKLKRFTAIGTIDHNRFFSTVIIRLLKINRISVVLLLCPFLMFLVCPIVPNVVRFR